MSLFNPFTSGTTLGIPDQTSRFPQSLPASANTTPFVTTAQTMALTSAQITMTLANLNSINAFYPGASNQFNFTPNQMVSFTNTLALFNTLSAGSITFTIAQLQDIVVTSQMIRSWSRVNVNPITTANIITAEGVVKTLNITASGTTYITGTYTNITLTGGTGVGAAANITVSAGGITSMTIVRGGFGYKTGDVLTCLNTDLVSPAGTGFTCSPATFSSTAIQTVTDIAFPNGATTIICNDGYFICEQYGTGAWWVSKNQDGTYWDGLSTASIESRSDTLVAVDSTSGGQVILFGIKSMEFWYDAGLTPLPYQRISGNQQDYGLAAKWSRAYVGNSIMFLGQNYQGQPEVMQMPFGGAPEGVSTSDINNLINKMPVVNDAIAYSFTQDGHEFYVITFPTGNRSFLYDNSTDMWHEWQSGLNEYNRHLTSLGYSYNYNCYASDCVNGNIYLIDTFNYTDNGSLIRREVDSIHINENGNIFGIDELVLDMERGDAQLVSKYGDDDNPQISVQVSKDHGRTFGLPRMTSLNHLGHYKPRVIWRRFGTARDMVFKFVQTSAVPFIINFAAGVVRIGKS